MHELLVRVTADLSVPDGPGYETLGLNLRGMVRTIHERHVRPEMPGIVAAFENVRTAAREFVARELAERLFAPAPPPPPRSAWSRWFGRAPSAPDEVPPESRALEAWKAPDTADPLERDCLAALVKIVESMLAHRGRLAPDAALLERLAVDRIGNAHGSDVVARLVAPIFERAVDAEGYRRLPVQAEPVVMNVKGASASGKSTTRPLQRMLAARLGIPWEDFALISPDYWRKYLLEYESLGPERRYGAMLTGRELEIVDGKLDRYMAAKAADGRMSHLLIDRFRFDSFAPERGRTADGRLLSRFGHRVFMFFMITPPAETVERAWKRGLTTGRFKAVDDLLYHNVEAFTGMPALFLAWVNAVERAVRFEFLDNGVPAGETPRTAAFGSNGSMTVLDVERMLDVDRFRKVRVDARTPDEVLDPAELVADANVDFLRRCAADIASLSFADHEGVYAHVERGRLSWWDDARLAAMGHDAAARVALRALGHDGSRCPPERRPPAFDAGQERRYTIGRWDP